MTNSLHGEGAGRGNEFVGGVDALASDAMRRRFVRRCNLVREKDWRWLRVGSCGAGGSGPACNTIRSSWQLSKYTLYVP